MSELRVVNMKEFVAVWLLYVKAKSGVNGMHYCETLGA
jgi:hypothetical protein